MISLERLLYAESDWSVQLVLGLLQALWWWRYMPYVARHYVRPFIDSRPWKKQWIDLHGINYKNVGMNLDQENTYEVSCWTVPMISQHMIGGLLALPMVFGLFDQRTNAALAVHGALTEFGFELQDLATRLYAVYFGTEAEKNRNPPGLLKMLCLHHAVGLSQVIPLNMYFRNSMWYHEGSVLLQCASAFSLLAQQYGMTLDMKVPANVRTMRNISVLTFVVIIYTRLLRYFYIWYFLNLEIYLAGVYPLAFIGLISGLSLMGFNAVMIKASYQRCAKYTKLYAKVADASTKTM